MTSGPGSNDNFDSPLDLALFLDLDGTLIDIAATPSGVSAPPGLVAMLARLSERLDGALAVLSGRTIAGIDGLLAPLRLCVAGVHGAEIRDEPEGSILRHGAGLPEGLIESARRLRELHPGVLVEEKGLAIAVHYRQAEGAGPELGLDLETRLRALAAAHSQTLDVLHGRMVVEVAPKQSSKGAALTRFMRSPRFSGRLPLMIGDDRTDLSAFAAAESLGGRGLRVGGEFFVPSGADFAGTDEVRQWLSELCETLAIARNDGEAR